MTVVINKYGFIKGGLCEERLQRRSSRASGSWSAWNDIKDNPKHVRRNNGWLQIIKLPEYKGPGMHGTGDMEIGFLRMQQEIFSQLVVSKRKFREKWMTKWIEGTASCEFGIASKTPLSIITKGEGITGSLVPPKGQDDAYYEQIHGVPASIVRESKNN